VQWASGSDPRFGRITPAKPPPAGSRQCRLYPEPNRRKKNGGSSGGAVDLPANVERLVELAYSAAVEDDLWRDWTFELVQQFGTPGALFWVIDSTRFDMCQNHMCFLGADNMEVSAEYLSGPVLDDPQMQRVCSARRSEIYLDTDHVDLDDPRALAYLDWQESRVGTRHHITASVVLAEGLEAGVSLHRSRLQGPASADVVAQMHVLFPDFARALQLGFRHAEAVQESWWDGLCQTDDRGRVLLTRSGRILRANRAAEAIFARRDGLGVSADRFRCEDSRCDDAVTKAVAQACLAPGGHGGCVAVRRHGNSAPYVLNVYPLVERTRFLAPFGARALVCISDPAMHAGLTKEQKTMLLLTSREAEIADLLMKGHSVASASECLGITYNTARLHLGALFKKTSTSRQSELMLFLERTR
jgi:DNA-binding CsgD family transcriptional regulator